MNRQIQIQRSETKIQRGAIQIRRNKVPSIDAVLAPDPVPVEYPPNGDLLDNLDAEERAVISAIRQARKEYADFVRALDDNEFYCCLVFQSKAQKEEFLKQAGWEDTAPKQNYGNMFLNGLEVARRMGIQVKLEDLADYKLRGNPKLFGKEVIIHASEGAGGKIHRRQGQGQAE